jgi:hypothetical protein
MLNIERKDGYFMAGSALAVVVISVIAGIVQAPVAIELVLDILLTVSIFGSFYFVYKGVKISGGEMARYMSIIVLGLGIYGVTLVPHAYWHILGRPTPEFIPVGSVSALAHTMTVMAFIFVAYGFYLFYEGGKA